MKRLPFFAALAFALAFQAGAHAAVREERVDYKHGDVTLAGFFAFDDAIADKRPVVLVFHEWKGPGEYVEKRSRRLAEMGYLAFAVDMYGKDVRPETHEEAGKISGLYRSDRGLTRERARAGLARAIEHPLADPSRVAAIGYCFGGMAALELARSGADLRSVATFHAALASPTPEDAKNVRSVVWAFHGAADPHVGRDQIDAFRSEMGDAGVSFRLIEYPGVLHSFTVSEANDPEHGMKYDKAADEQSWAELAELLKSTFV